MPVEKINDSSRRAYCDLGMHPENFLDNEYLSFFGGYIISRIWYRGYFLDPKARNETILNTLSHTGTTFKKGDEAGVRLLKCHIPPVPSTSTFAFTD